MNVRLRMYKYCYSNLGAFYAKGLCAEPNSIKFDFGATADSDSVLVSNLLFGKFVVNNFR